MIRSLSRWRARVLAVGLTVAAVPLLCPGAAGAVPGGNTCRDVDVPVVMPLAGEVNAHGRLCLPPGAEPAVVQILLHGGTYNGLYWDFPYEPDRYSYVRAANRAGYATFTVDQIGYGRSTRPLSTLVTDVGQADVAHQLVTKLRSGEIGSTRFSKVVLVGHSMGSGTAALESSRHRDVDGVVLTGFSHRMSPLGTAGAAADGIYPAPLDPKFGLSVDPGYFTTKPGARDTLFHNPPDVDPRVQAIDDQTKDVVSSTEFGQNIGLAFTAPTSLGITAPVLIANGSADAIFCGATDCSTAEALDASERPYFAPGESLDTYVLAGAGHAATLARNAPELTTAILDWTRENVGR